jgi:hypothetical protein
MGEINSHFPHIYYSKVIGKWLSYTAQEKMRNMYSMISIITHLLPASRHLLLPSGPAIRRFGKIINNQPIYHSPDSNSCKAISSFRSDKLLLC